VAPGGAGVGTAVGGALGSAVGVVVGTMWPSTMGDGTLPGSQFPAPGNGSSYGDDGMQCKPNSDDPCKYIQQKIKEIMRELMRRYNHQCRDKKGQWESHLPAFDGKKRQLLTWVLYAESLGCPVPAKAYQWLVTSCPLPGTNVKNNPSPGY
jgi:hypothetical protein